MRTDVDAQFPDPHVAWLSYEVAGITGWERLLEAVFALVGEMIACDEIGWTGVDRKSGRVAVSTSATPYDSSATDLLLQLNDHPIINFLMGAKVADPFAPVRVGDVVSDRAFRATRTWADLFRPRGIDRQLTVATAFGASRTAGTAWSVTEPGRNSATTRWPGSPRSALCWVPWRRVTNGSRTLKTRRSLPTAARGFAGERWPARGTGCEGC